MSRRKKGKRANDPDTPPLDRRGEYDSSKLLELIDSLDKAKPKRRERSER